MRRIVVAGFLLLARAALGHDVRVDPSTCVLDTLSLDEAVVVAPAVAGDAVRVVYDTATSTAQFQPLERSRGFTSAGEAGAIGLPAAFNASLGTGGDLQAEQVVLDVTLGGVTARVPVTLTTGLVATPGAVVGGEPIDASGRFLMVGAIPAAVLPSALAGVTIVRFGCQLQPVPAVDLFAIAPAVDSLAGTLSADRGSLRGVLRDAPALDAWTGQPALLEVRVAGQSAAVLRLPDGFQGGGRRRTGRSNDGSQVTLRRGPDRGTLRLRADLASVFLPGTPSGAVDVELTLVSGATTARGARSFRASGGRVRRGA
jgi:hypothetical protein